MIKGLVQERGRVHNAVLFGKLFRTLLRVSDMDQAWNDALRETSVREISEEQYLEVALQSTFLAPMKLRTKFSRLLCSKPNPTWIRTSRAPDWCLGAVYALVFEYARKRRLSPHLYRRFMKSEYAEPGSGLDHAIVVDQLPQEYQYIQQRQCSDCNGQFDRSSFKRKSYIGFPRESTGCIATRQRCVPWRKSGQVALRDPITPVIDCFGG
jgi:hypothetical protein